MNDRPDESSPEDDRTDEDRTAEDRTDADAQSSDSETGSGGSGGSQPRRRGSALREIVLIVGIALVVSALVRAFLFQAFYIPSGSMENTLRVDDRVVVNKLAGSVGEINRGDVVVFRDPGGWLVGHQVVEGNAVQRTIRKGLEVVGLAPSSSEQDVIKRVIGVGGDRVRCCDRQGRVTVNGVPLDEPYVYPGDVPSEIEFDVTVPAGRLFVMGDHRDNSNDSRVHVDDPEQGSIAEDDVVGRAVLIVWPLSRWQTLDAPATFDDPRLERATG